MGKNQMHNLKKYIFIHVSFIQEIEETDSIYSRFLPLLNWFIRMCIINYIWYVHIIIASVQNVSQKSGREKCFNLLESS